MRYFVETSTPHQWSHGSYTREFDDEVEARAYAQERAKGSWGQESYVNVKIHHVVETEEIN